MNGLINDFFKGKKILITGAGGYIGTNIVSKLQKISCTVVRVSRQKQLEAYEGSNADFIDITTDVASELNWRDHLMDVDIVYHLAAQTSVYVANDNPEKDLSANVLPILKILVACHSNGRQPSVIFSGTSTQVGFSKQLPVDEKQIDEPITIYDLHKKIAEQYIKYYTRIGAIRGASLRLTNVYGPGPRSSSADRGILNMMIKKALDGQSLTIYGKGDYIRDYIYIDDVVNALLLSAMHIGKTGGHHFVIGSGKGCTIKDAIAMISRRVNLQTGISAKIHHIDPPGTLLRIEERNFVANPDAFVERTEWRPNVSLKEGIDRTIASFCG